MEIISKNYKYFYGLTHAEISVDYVQWKWWHVAYQLRQYISSIFKNTLLCNLKKSKNKINKLEMFVKHLCPLPWKHPRRKWNPGGRLIWLPRVPLLCWAARFGLCNQTKWIWDFFSRYWVPVVCWLGLPSRVPEHSLLGVYDLTQYSDH